MNRTVRSAALTAALGAAALVNNPAAALADAASPGPGITINCDYCQIAGGDIFNVGNGDGAGETPGVGEGQVLIGMLSTVFLQKVSQVGDGYFPRFTSDYTAIAVGPVSVVYAAPEGYPNLGQVRISVNPPEVTCTADGQLACMVRKFGSDRLVSIYRR